MALYGPTVDEAETSLSSREPSVRTSILRREWVMIFTRVVMHQRLKIRELASVICIAMRHMKHRKYSYLPIMTIAESIYIETARQDLSLHSSSGQPVKL